MAGRPFVVAQGRAPAGYPSAPLPVVALEGLRHESCTVEHTVVAMRQQAPAPGPPGPCRSRTVWRIRLGNVVVRRPLSRVCEEPRSDGSGAVAHRDKMRRGARRKNICPQMVQISS